MTLVPHYKITVFVPHHDKEFLLKAVLNVTTLEYGSYDQVSWRSYPGVEQFRPLANAKPTVGKIGELCEQPSIQMTFTVPHDEQLLTKILGAITQAHP